MKTVDSSLIFRQFNRKCYAVRVQRLDSFLSKVALIDLIVNNKDYEN